MYPLGNGDAALDQLSLFLGVADAKKLPPGWSKLARFRLQIVNHINPAKTISKGFFFSLYFLHLLSLYLYIFS